MRPSAGKDPRRQLQGYTSKKKGQAFEAIIAAGGRAVCFEAKSKEGDRVNQTAVTQEQKEALDDHTDLGAATFVLLCMNGIDYYRVPWRIWRNMKRHYGRMYMTLEELEFFRIRFDNTLKFLE